ncbi:4a-hydroxytetrahydrobiopterin dehydratase [Methylosinus sp. LW4]|uniref:4a-hydroxytetrahydrobiopterin dehydratase n=1 Tax=Methylosinus sp. LW4 TaxID=136993 RepID=UPI000376A1FD
MKMPTLAEKTSLAEKSCTPCRGGVPPLGRAEAEALLAAAPDWTLMDEARRIERGFRFGNFREAAEFVRQIGELAEAEGHHPDIAFGWGYATISLQTKKIGGLHENDVIMATKIDRIFSRRQGLPAGRM